MILKTELMTMVGKSYRTKDLQRFQKVPFKTGTI